MKKPELNSELKQCIIDINDAFRKKRTPSDSLKRPLSGYCKKQYLFDLIHAIHYLGRPISSYTVEIILKKFLSKNDTFGWLFLFSIIPPDGDPMNWEIDDYDEHLYLMMVDFLESLNLKPRVFKHLAEYQLRRAVDNLLMSRAFGGCGSKMILEWHKDKFYESLLSKEYHFDLEKDHTLIDFAEYFISRVAKLLKKYKLPKLMLGISAAMSYYAPDNEYTAKPRENFFSYLLSIDIHPLLFDLVINNFLVPENGLLLPDYKKIVKASKEEDALYRSIFGLVNLKTSLSVFKNIIEEDNSAIPKEYDHLVAGYIEWHHSFELQEELVKKYEKRYL